jgi:hypothetical protein
MSGFYQQPTYFITTNDTNRTMIHRRLNGSRGVSTLFEETKGSAVVVAEQGLTNPIGLPSVPEKKVHTKNSLWKVVVLRLRWVGFLGVSLFVYLVRWFLCGGISRLLEYCLFCRLRGA